MSTVTTTMPLFLHAKADGTKNLYCSDMSKWPESFGVCLGEVDATVTYQDIDKDPRAALIEKLESQIETERAESQAKVNRLLDQISKLKCIEYTGAA